MNALVRRLCPHADPALEARLRAAGQWLKWANYLLVEFQLARGHSWSLGRPYWLTIDPTNFCQLQCPFCPTGAGRGVRDKAALTLEHFELLMERLGPTAIHLDMMNWGEPVLNKDLPRMIASAKRHGIEVKIDCNLNELSQAMADALVAAGPDILSVSIDGASQETYETYRVGGDFNAVLTNIRKIKKAKESRRASAPQLIWQFLVFKHNEHEIERARALAAELGMEFSLVSPFMPNEDAVLAAWLAERPEHRLYAPPSAGAANAGHPREVVKIQRTVPQRTYRARRFKPADLYSPAYLLRAVYEGAAREAWRRAWEALRAPKPPPPEVPFSREAKPICKWPWAGITVNPDGSASPCCSVEDQGDDFGRALGPSFAGLWNGRSYRRARRHVARYARGRAGITPESDHVCERCTAIGYANFQFPQRRREAVD